MHVTGTNGKGTVATKIAKGLEFEGFWTGLFISPHIERFTEWMTVNGEEISEDNLIRLSEYVLENINEGINQFDAITMIAYKYFEEQKVDWGVIEVGIGGKIDSTNIINSDLSIITSVGLDHCEILGDTIDKIATDKAGIIKSGKHFILGPKTP